MTFQIRNKQTHKAVGEAIEARLAVLGAEFGIKFEVRGGHYGDQPDFKIIVHTVDADGELRSPEAKSWIENSWMHRLDPEALGREIRLEGMWYRIVGLNPKSRKRPVLVDRVIDGKGFNWMVGPVREALDNPPRRDITPRQTLIL